MVEKVVKSVTDSGKLEETSEQLKKDESVQKTIKKSQKVKQKMVVMKVVLS